MTLLRPRGLQPSRLLSPWDFSDKNTGVGCHFFLPFSRGSAQSGIKAVSPALQADSLSSEPPGKVCFTLSSHPTLAPEVRCDETMGGLSRLSVQDQVGPASHGHLFPCYGFLRSSARCDTEGVGPEPWLHWG